MGCGASTDTEVDVEVHKHLHQDTALRSIATTRNPRRRKSQNATASAFETSSAHSLPSTRTLSVATGRGRAYSRSATTADRETR
eukprot:CAMPEP_0174834184 /NCGR_PEP_ID=MMETSP1114-20130205/4676_1 /TAXON_ID=312471 /ORGANISM="Neobodo designis, Strain CCAP 1951/1" /LENGTH=83 /DNA_ID=CAMNT_0016068089 /DNA_START=573 /DNA_END=821 /DNA_ORIENTATION=+